MRNRIVAVAVIALIAITAACGGGGEAGSDGWTKSSLEASILTEFQKDPSYGAQFVDCDHLSGSDWRCEVTSNIGVQAMNIKTRMGDEFHYWETTQLFTLEPTQ